MTCTLAVIPSPNRPRACSRPKAPPASPGLWVYNDDNTDFNCLAAIARVAPQIHRHSSRSLQIVREQTKR